MKYRSQWHTNILRSDIGSYWLIIPKYDVQTLNSFQDIRQNHWNMKYRLQWPTFILRSNVVSCWLIIPKYDVHTSNSLQDIRQNHWTMKYRSQWPTFILRSKVVSYWLIIPKYDVHIIWNRHHLKGNQPICSEKHLAQGLESMIFRWFYMHLLMFSPRGGRGDTLGIRQSTQSLPPRIWQTTLPQGRDFRCLSYKT